MFWKYAKNKIRLGVEVKACKDCWVPLRSCLADGAPAVFHRWMEEDRVTFALVEYPDGSVGKVKPELITFLDRREV